MKITCSVASLALCISASALSGCVSDQPAASPINTSQWDAGADSSPSGIWLINSHMTDDVNSAGNEFYTEATSRQLVVIEDLGNDQYQLHECSLAANGSYPATPLEFHTSGLQAASSFTDYNSRTPYSESEKIEIRLEGKELHGMIAYYDRNLDGSYDGRQVSYMKGMKISEAQTLDAITEEEIESLLGSDINLSARAKNLGQTCAGVASVETSGTQRTAVINSADVTQLITPEAQPNPLIAAEIMVASGETN
jgi:hypothetical protein